MKNRSDGNAAKGRPAVWSAGRSGKASTIAGLLEQAAGSPHGITVIDRDLTETRLGYKDLAAFAARGAHLLRRNGVEADDRVCLISKTSVDLLAALFSTWYAGAVPVVMPLPRRRRELAAYLTGLTERFATITPAAVLVADDLLIADDLRELLVTASRAPVPVMRLAELQYMSQGRGEQHGPGREDDIGLVQFTSGTTGSSRAVSLTHRQIISNLAAIDTVVRFDRDRDVIVSWLPLYHDMGIIGTLLEAVCFGLPLVLEPTKDFIARPGSWLEALSAYRGTVTASPNFGYALAARDLAANPRSLDLRPLRCACNGSEPVDIETVQSFAAAAAPHGFRPEAMVPVYGLAECSLAVTFSGLGTIPRAKPISKDVLETERRATPPEPGAATIEVVPCGKPLPGMKISIRDDAGNEVPFGNVGEICVRSPSLMSGYWADADATSEVMRGDLLHTGDLGFWDDDGLVICGRSKDVIIIGGRNLYPEDYERHAERMTGVRDGNVIVFAVPERERMVVVAETTKRSAQAVSLAEGLLASLREAIGRAPEEVVLIPPGTLPKTSSGKRQRSLCKSRYMSGELTVVARANSH